MVYNYRTFDASHCSPDLTCSVCLDPMANTDAVAHEDGGDLHPIHRECAKASTAVFSSCGVCRKAINPGSILSLSERCAAVVKPILGRVKQKLKDPVVGMGVGISLASVMHIILSQPTFLKMGIVAYGVVETIKKITPVVEHRFGPVVRCAANGVVIGAVCSLVSNAYGFGAIDPSSSFPQNYILYGAAGAIGAAFLEVDEEG